MAGLYIHMPFCIKKCLYCDFVSYTGTFDYAAYINALIAEMLLVAEQWSGVAFDTIYIGGGTPSILPSILISKLTEGLYKHFHITDNLEFTIEANPATFDKVKLKDYLRVGINRLSIGVQSFNDVELSAIGRIHDAKGAHSAVFSAQGAGFKRINIDLMFSLPYQTRESWARSLSEAVSLGVEHISCYSLTVDDNTPIYQLIEDKVLTIADDDTDRHMCHDAVNYLTENGLYRYEVSNFARTGYQSRHNMNYWNCGDYLGLGCAAHSHKDGVRSSNTSDIDEYIRLINEGSIPQDSRISLTPEQRISEAIIMALRTSRGCDMIAWESIFKQEIKQKYTKAIVKHINNGLLIMDSNYIRLTDKGFDLMNLVLCDFID